MGVKKVILAYSGGLDTSIILKWLIETYRCEVVAFSADLGQDEELDGIEKKALATGAIKARIEDLREEFASEFVFPAFRANAIYEGQYLLGTSIARPLIARRQISDSRGGRGGRGEPRRHREGKRPGAVRAGLHGAQA